MRLIHPLGGNRPPIPIRQRRFPLGRRCSIRALTAAQPQDTDLSLVTRIILKTFRSEQLLSPTIEKLPLRRENPRANLRLP